MRRCTYKSIPPRTAQDISQRAQFEAMQGTIELGKPRNQTPTIEDLEDKITAQKRQIKIMQEWIHQLETSKKKSEDPCYCKRCGDRFARPAYVLTHKCWPGHPSSTRCETCHTNFARGGSLRRHQTTCQRLDGKDSTANKELHVEAIVRTPAGSAHPQSEVCSLVSSRNATSINHTDADSTFGTSSSYSDVDSVSVTSRGGPGTGCAEPFTSSLLNDISPSHHYSSEDTSPKTNVIPSIMQYQQPTDMSYPAGFLSTHLDQGKAFHQNPFGTHVFEGGYGGQNATYDMLPSNQNLVSEDTSPKTNVIPSTMQYQQPTDMSYPAGFLSTHLDQGKAFHQNPFGTHIFESGYGSQNTTTYDMLPSNQNLVSIQDSYTTSQPSQETIQTGTAPDTFQYYNGERPIWKLPLQSRAVHGGSDRYFREEGNV